MNKVDLIIVGGGSAGCIIANQIVRHTNLKVLLIEAGPFDRNPIIKIEGIKLEVSNLFCLGADLAILIDFLLLCNI